MAEVLDGTVAGSSDKRTGGAGGIIGDDVRIGIGIIGASDDEIGIGEIGA
jgi:hypothetical protein